MVVSHVGLLQACKQEGRVVLGLRYGWLISGQGNAGTRGRAGQGGGAHLAARGRRARCSGEAVQERSCHAVPRRDVSVNVWVLARRNNGGGGGFSFSSPPLFPPLSWVQLF